MSDYHDRLYNYDSEAIRQQIEDSCLFALDKEKEANAYARERYKMIDNLARYLFAIDESENINFGVEIAELAERCIKSYNASVGTPFLMYFMASWKIEYKRLKGKEAKEEFLRGVHVNKKLMEKILKFVRYAKSVGKNYQAEGFVQLIADETDRSVKEIQEYITLIAKGVTSNELEDADGELTDVFDIFSMTNSIEDTLDEEESIVRWGLLIEEIFDRLQERQKPLISDLITLRVIDSEYSSENIILGLFNRSFFNKTLYMRSKREEKITARLIAEEHGVTEQSASRTLKIFLAKIK